MYGLLYSMQNESNIASHNNNDESHNHNVKWKKPYISVRTKLNEQEKTRPWLGGKTKGVIIILNVRMI